MATNKVSPVSAADYVRVPLPTSIASPHSSLADTISSHHRQVPDPNCELLPLKIQEAMMQQLVDLLHLQALVEQSSMSRISESTSISREELEKRLDPKKKTLERLESWVKALQKRIERLENIADGKESLSPSLKAASPTPASEKPLSNVRKVLQYLRWFLTI